MKEGQLLKALSDMEAIAKGGDSSGKKTLPKTTAEANGGLSKEGDAGKVSATAKSADAEEVEDEFDFDALDADDESIAAKGMGGDEDESEDEDEGSEDEGSEDEDEDEGEEDMNKGKGKAKKGCKKSQSLSDLIKSDDGSSEVLDVAPFLETLVEQVSKSLDKLTDQIAGISARQNSQHKVLKALGNVQIGLQKSVEGVMDKPAGQRKSVLSKSEVVERFETETPNFSKSQVLDGMFEMLQKGQIDGVAISRYEATSTMEPNVREKVEAHLLNKSA